jgi:hypothetical protein
MSVRAGTGPRLRLTCRSRASSFRGAPIPCNSARLYTSRGTGTKCFSNRVGFSLARSAHPRTFQPCSLALLWHPVTHPLYLEHPSKVFSCIWPYYFASSVKARGCGSLGPAPTCYLRLRFHSAASPGSRRTGACSTTVLVTRSDGHVPVGQGAGTGGKGM